MTLVPLLTQLRFDIKRTKFTYGVEYLCNPAHLLASTSITLALLFEISLFYFLCRAHKLRQSIFMAMTLASCIFSALSHDY